MNLFGSGAEILEAGRRRLEVLAFDPFQGPITALMMRGRRHFFVYRIASEGSELGEDAGELTAALLMILTQADEAQKKIHPLLDRYPDSPTVAAMWGQCLSATHRYEEATETLERALQSLPCDPGIQAALAQCRKRRDDLEEALRYPEILLPGDELLASDLLARAAVLLERDPDHARRIAQALVQHSDYAPIQARARLIELMLAQAAEPSAGGRALAERMHDGDLVEGGESLVAGLLTVLGKDPAQEYIASALQKSQRGDYAGAVAHYRTALRQSPNDFTACNNLAWLLAACPDDTVRNGIEAVELATRACQVSKWTDCTGLDTLAGACAEAGQFDQAVSWSQQAIALLAPGDPRLADYEQSLALYRRRTPHRDTPANPPVAEVGADPLSCHDAIRTSGFPAAAFQFLFRGLTRAQQTAAAPDSRKVRHVTGQDLCHALREQAIVEFGSRAKSVLANWQIGSTADFGRMVFTLVRAGLLSTTEQDRLEDFDWVYDFDTAFDAH